MEVRRGRSPRHGWGCPDPQSPGRSGAAFVPENPLNDRVICTHEPAQCRPLPDSGNDHSAAPSWRGDLLLLVAVNFMWALKWTLSKVALRELEPVSITLFPMVGRK